MEIVRAWEEEGVTIPAPFSRHIKVLFAPDKHNVPDLMFSFAIIDRGSQTDSHIHDESGELIFVVHGRGVCVYGEDNQEVELVADTVLWVPAGERHQIKNLGFDTLKLATVFVPPYTAEFNYNRCLRAAEAARAAAD